MVADRLTSSTKSQRQIGITEVLFVTPMRLTLGDGCILLVSLSICTADTIASVVLGLSYFAAGHMLQGLLTCLLVFVPSIIIQLLSAKFYHEDGARCRSPTGIFHLLLCQPFARYVGALVFWYKNHRRDLTHDAFIGFINLENDVYLLRFLQTMLQSAPQLTYQIYLLHVQAKFSVFTGVVACLCLLGVGWAVAAAASVRHKEAIGPCRIRFVWPSVFFETLTWMCVVFSRAVSAASFASVLGLWVVAVIGCHWLAMTVWITFQQSEICSSRVGKIFFSCILGVVYCFGFVNLNATRSRFRLAAFYILCLAENAAMMAAWYAINPADAMLSSWRIAQLCTALGVFLLGMLCTVVYHQFFHSQSKTTASNLVGGELVSHMPRDTSLQTPRSMRVVPNRSFKCRPANACLELYTPSRLSPILRRVMAAGEDSARGGLTCLDTTATLPRDHFHHYSINASDCLTPMVASISRRRGNETRASMTLNGLRPFSVVDCDDDDVESDLGGRVAAGSTSSADGPVVKVSDETALRQRCSESLQPSDIGDSNVGLHQLDEPALETDDRSELNLTEQLEGDISEVHSSFVDGEGTREWNTFTIA